MKRFTGGLGNLALNLLVPAVVVVLWEYTSRFSPLAPQLRNALPPPTSVLLSISHNLANGELGHDTAGQRFTPAVGFRRCGNHCDPDRLRNRLVVEVR